MNVQEAKSAWMADAGMLAARGVHFPAATTYLPDEWKQNFALAMDALPTAFTDPNAGVPAILTTVVDPEVVRVIFTPNRAAEIFGEQKKGSWTDDTMMFNVVEQTGEVSAYGDYNENGRASVNQSWVYRQNYLFQVIEEYGDREMERANLTRLNFVAETDAAAATVMNKFANLTYHFGVAGLQNYGVINDPSLPAAITPATKAATGVKWTNNGAIVATASEVYADLQALYLQLVTQTQGEVKMDDQFILIVPPQAQVGITAVNSFNVSVTDLLKKNFPNIEIVSDPLYGAVAANNPQGVVAGNTVQLIAKTINGQKTAYVAFSEKMRAHPIVRGVSSQKKKVTGGTWGAIIRYPLAVAQMVGV
jgi:hypothetical protein